MKMVRSNRTVETFGWFDSGAPTRNESSIPIAAWKRYGERSRIQNRFVESSTRRAPGTDSLRAYPVLTGSLTVLPCHRSSPLPSRGPTERRAAARTARCAGFVRDVEQPTPRGSQIAEPPPGGLASG